MLLRHSHHQVRPENLPAADYFDLITNGHWPTSELNSAEKSNNLKCSRFASWTYLRVGTTRKMNGTSSPNPIPASFYRGGTSNALLIRRSHLPADQAEWEPILAGALGSPDPYGRQLNGMSGGFSSLSKACIVAPSQRPDADVDYAFVQMDIKSGKQDLSGTCRSMTSAIAPFAIDEGLVPPDKFEENGEFRAMVRVFNTNTEKIIHCTVSIDQTTNRFKPTGAYAIDGVPGTGSRIALHFIYPGGAKTGKTLPTGKPMDDISVSNLSTDFRFRRSTLPITLLDVANPAVIISGDDIGVTPNTTPDELESDPQRLAMLEQIRKEGARMMGLDPGFESIPKLVMVCSPSASDKGINLVARVLSMRQAHRAIPLTIALNLGVACQIPGTLP